MGGSSKTILPKVLGEPLFRLVYELEHGQEITGLPPRTRQTHSSSEQLEQQSGHCG